MKCDKRFPAMSQAGVGLIEILVAVLVLSIGFLGVAALEARSMSTNNSAMARSMATIASYSILDAMRADIGAARSGAYNTTVKADACPAASTDTSAATMASTQLNKWCAQLKKNLGGVSSTTGTVSCSATGECTVTVNYDDSRGGWNYADSQKVVTKGML